MEPVKEITFERIVDAPIETVWHAWTDPKTIMQWWGPDNVDIPECEMEPRVGGKIYIVMKAGEAMGPYAGTLWPMLGEYTAYEPHTHLAYAVKAWTEGTDKEETMLDQVTELTLAEEDGKTKMTVKATINSTGPKAGGAAEGMQYGFNQQFAKLEAYLATS
jgi:uncharacterized protein YndB with AHSA1/START domain